MQKDLADGFRLSFDHYGRSSSPENHALTQHFAGRLADAGLISEVAERQVYSPADGRFLPDRYIEGTCPNCGYPRARGDQCENCTKQLDPTDLIEPRSAISGSTDLEIRETKHLYLRQSLLRDELRRWILTKTDWPVLSTSIALKWLDDGEGLQDRSHHPRPRLGHPGPARRRALARHGGQGLLRLVRRPDRVHRRHRRVGATPTACGEAGWQRWWREDEGAADVRYVQFMGKDNVPFHTLSFPATILGANSTGRAVEARRLHQVLQLPELRGRQVLHLPGPRRLHGPGARDPARRLLALVADVQRPRGLGFQLHLGELPGRREQGPRRRPRQLRQPRHQVRRRPLRRDRARRRRYGPAEAAVTAELARRLAAYEAAMEAIELRKAAQELRAIWVAGNEYLQAAAPWTAIKTDPDRAAAITRFSLNLIRLYAVLCRPFLPDASDAMLAALGLDAADWPDRHRRRARRPAARASPSPCRRRALRQARRRPPRASFEARFAGSGG